MNKQQPHFLVGATLGTEDRGDICIRDAADNLLYRMSPTSKHPFESLSEVLRVCAFQSRAAAKRDNLVEPVTPASQARDLLLQFDEAVRDIRRVAQSMPSEQTQNLEAVLARTRELSEAVLPVLAGLELAPA